MKRTSISRRLVGGLALLSLLVTLVATSMQVAIDYRHRVALLKQDADARVDAIDGSLAGAVWNVDPDSTHLLLQGLQRTPGIALVQLRTLDGELDSAGNAPRKALDVRRYPLVMPSAGGRHVGELSLTLDDLDIRARVMARLRAILLITVSVTAAGCFVVFLLYRRLLVRHLERIAAYARELDLDNLDRALRLERPAHAAQDELDGVVSGFDRMRERMAQALRLRRQHEDELEQHRNHLAQLVDERTEALSQRNRDLHVRTQELEQARSQAETLANTDHLTGLGNRRHFYATAEALLARSAVGAMMLDIDHFKQVNDRHGHASGDRVIAEVAARLRAELPPDALLGRLGGEEFAALLQGTDARALQALAEQVRVRVAATPIGIGTLPPLSCTVSIGIAMADGADAGIDRLLGRADDALYRAKEAGRNRIVAWTKDAANPPHASEVRRREPARDEDGQDLG